MRHSILCSTFADVGRSLVLFFAFSALPLPQRRFPSHSSVSFWTHVYPPPYPLRSVLGSCFSSMSTFQREDTILMDASQPCQRFLPFIPFTPVSSHFLIRSPPARKALALHSAPVLIALGLALHSTPLHRRCIGALASI